MNGLPVMAESNGNEVKTRGVVAEYDTPDALISAANRVREAGYTKTDAFSPFPVHGIDDAIGIKATKLPWIVLCAGTIGCLTGITMQVWMNAHEYPYIISGKPYISLPAFIPVSFELTILFSAFAAFFGQWILNGLPRFSNPMFTNPKFDAATDDKFFLYIDSADARYDEAGATGLLQDTSPLSVENVVDDSSPTCIPQPLIIIGLVLLALAAFPPLIIANMRVTKSGTPRVHIFWDMDFMPSKGPQESTILFRDGRTMRPNVPGTVSRGDLDFDVDFQTGIKMDELALIDPDRATRLVSYLRSQEDADAANSLSGDDSQKGESGEGKNSTEDVDPKFTEEQAKASSEEAEAPEATDEPKKVEAKEESEPSKTGEDEKAEVSSDATKASEEADTSVDDSAASESPAKEPEETDSTPWVTENPLALSRELLEHGKERFQIYCAVCHGRDGKGNGLVNQRAQKILSTTWSQPSSLQNPDLFSDKYADGKLFNTISNGIRRMPGYAGQIPVKDRWAIVAYVRVLQASRNVSLDALPQGERDRLNAEASSQWKAIQEAEAERKRKEAEKKRKAEEAAKQASDKTESTENAS